MRIATTAVTSLVVAFTSFTATAGTIGPASEWDVDVSIILNRGSPAPTFGVTDSLGGVTLSYNSPTGGNLVGTTTRQFDFTRSADQSMSVAFDLSVDTVNGGFNNVFSLALLRNGAVLETLIPTTAENTTVAEISGISFDLDAGDVWGIRAIAGNFARSTSAFGSIEVSQVPVPAALPMMLAGVASLLVMRRRRTVYMS